MLLAALDAQLGEIEIDVDGLVVQIGCQDEGTLAGDRPCCNINVIRRRKAIELGFGVEDIRSEKIKRLNEGGKGRFDRWRGGVHPGDDTSGAVVEGENYGREKLLGCGITLPIPTQENVGIYETRDGWERDERGVSKALRDCPYNLGLVPTIRCDPLCKLVHPV